MSTHLLSGPFPEDRPGYDGEVYVWFLGPHKVRVCFTGTAVEVGEEGLSTRAEKALLSQGQSEMEEFLTWKTPPEEIEFSTDNYPSILGGEE